MQSVRAHQGELNDAIHTQKEQQRAQLVQCFYFMDFTGSLTLDRTLSALCCSMTLRGLGSSRGIPSRPPLPPVV